MNLLEEDDTLNEIQFIFVYLYMFEFVEGGGDWFKYSTSCTLQISVANEFDFKTVFVLELVNHSYSPWIGCLSAATHTVILV